MGEFFDFEPYRRSNYTIDLGRVFESLPLEYNSKTIEYQKALSYIKQIEQFREITSRQLAATIIVTAVSMLDIASYEK